MDVTDGVASVNGTPAVAAARASSASPWNQQTPATPVGAIASGMDMGLLNRLVAIDRRDTSTRTLFLSLMRAKAPRLPRSDASSSEPRSKNSKTPRGKRRRGSATRAAGHACGVVRIAYGAVSWIAGSRATGELVHVGTREHNRAGCEQSLDDRRMSRRDVVLERRRGRRARHAGDIDVVFHDDRQAAQHAEGLAARTPTIAHARIFQHALLVDPGQRLERLEIASARQTAAGEVLR